MKKIFKEKNTEWHRWFAWHPVFCSNTRSIFSSLVWLTYVERRWVPFWTDDLTIFRGFYQYHK
jgi:hypothetical protein